MNPTHQPGLRSWVESAQGVTDFPIQNLPYGVFRLMGRQEEPRVGVAIGDRVLDVPACHASGRVFTGLAQRAAEACSAPSLNPLMTLGPAHWSALRGQISSFLAAGSPAYQADRGISQQVLVPMAEVELFLPAQIGDYSDFYASIHHATNVGSMFRPDNPLLPNYKWVPIGYHGRASSVVVSGTPVRRPHGQIKPPERETPVYGPSRSLDYELELGCFVGPGNPLGEPIPLERAGEHLFGLCLVNDWSARDIQTWEYQPLGPFLSKSFATTISPWVVSFEALEPFRVSAFTRPQGDPQPLPYLDSTLERTAGGLDVTVEAHLLTARMRESRLPAQRLSRSSAAHLYWTVGQMVTHHTSNGCNLRPGDLVATGTISGPDPNSRGCLLELTRRGAEPITLPTGEIRKFLEDGDEVILRGYCEREGYVRIGFGECRGTIANSE